MQEKFQIQSPVDHLELDALFIRPDEKPIKGIVQVCHGMAEHKERYLPFLRFLSEHGIAGVIHDHRGHGASVRKDTDLGYLYVKDTDALVRDAFAVTQQIKKRFPGVPVILFGHSMGSLVVRTYLKQHDDAIDALIVCGPPAENKMAGMGEMLARVLALVCGERAKSKFLDRLALGEFEQKFLREGSKNAWIAADPAVVQAYDQSPLCGFSFTLNGYVHLFSLMQKTYRLSGWKMQHPDLPVLFIRGEQDPCTINAASFQKTVAFLKERGYRSVDDKTYPGARHEILNDRCREETFQDVLDWILSAALSDKGQKNS